MCSRAISGNDLVHTRLQITRKKCDATQQFVTIPVQSTRAVTDYILKLVYLKFSTLSREISNCRDLKRWAKHEYVMARVTFILC